MKFTSEVSLKIRTAIKVKMAELGNDVYEELPDYIMVMVANRKSEEQMTEDLSLFLGDNTQQFTSWLHSLLSKLQSVASVSAAEKRASVSTPQQDSGAIPTQTDSESEYEELQEDASYAIPSSDEASKGVINPDEEEQSDSQRSDSLSVDHADSVSGESTRSRSNEPTLAFNSDSLKTKTNQSSKTDNGAHEKVFKKRKMNPETRKFRMKSRKLDDGECSKSESVATVSESCDRTTNNGTDESENENKIKSHSLNAETDFVKTGSKASDVSSSVLKTVVVEGEDLVQSKGEDSGENGLLEDDEKKKSEVELKVKQL